MWESMDLIMQSLHKRVVPAMRLMRQHAVMTLKCRIDLTTVSKEDRKGEGEEEASSAIMDAKNLEPHIFKEREAMAVQKSLF